MRVFLDTNNKYIGLNMVSADNEGFYKIGKIPAADLTADLRLSVQFYVGNFNIKNASVSSEGDFILAASTTNSAVLMDNSGNVVDSVPSDTDVTLVAYLDAETTYSPVVTVASGDNTIGSSGAGCNGGFGSLLGLLAMAFTASSLYISKKNAEI